MVGRLVAVFDCRSVLLASSWLGHEVLVVLAVADKQLDLLEQLGRDGRLTSASSSSTTTNTTTNRTPRTTQNIQVAALGHGFDLFCFYFLFSFNAFLLHMRLPLAARH